MENIFEKIEIIKKPTEDNISTSNPKAERTCEKKMTNVYMAKKKSVMYFEETSKSVKKIKENYELLVSPLVPEKYRLALPSELNVGDTVNIKYGVHVLKHGDTLSAIVVNPNCSSSNWKEIATINNITKPSNLRIGKHIIFPLKKSEQVRLTKDILYEKCSEVVVSELLHLVTEVKGFKKGESVVSKIEEEGKITQGDKLLTVTEGNKEKTELISIVTLENDDVNKGKAISQEFYLSPLSEKDIINEYQMFNFTLNNKEDKPVSYQFFNENRDKVEKKTIKSSKKKTWKDNFDEIEDKTVKLKVKSTSTSLPNEEEESEEVKLEKIRSFQMFYNELSKQQLEKEDWNILASYEILDSEKQKDLKEKYNLSKSKFESISELGKFQNELSKVSLDREDAHILASYEILDPKKRESLRKKYGIGDKRLEMTKNPISLEPTLSDACEDDIYYDNLENTSACDGKYDVNPMGSDFLGNEIEEKEWTVILGFSLSGDWFGKSGTVEIGVFRSKIIKDDGIETFVRGKYWALELGAGSTADVTLEKPDIGFVATTGHAYAPFTAYLDGKYNNTGIDFSVGYEGGISMITTISKPLYIGWTLDAGGGSPTAGGHSTIGYGEYFDVEEMIDFWTWEPWSESAQKKK